MPSSGQPEAALRGTQNSPLPPSVETAYYRKCIELKRRINEIEDSNDQARLRKIRINRQILKMRLERAFLLEQVQKRMDYNVDESDRSTSPPPTPQDKPLRSKRTHRKTTPPPQAGMTTITPASSVILPAPISSNAHPHPDHSYFDAASVPRPTGLPPIAPSASGPLPHGSFQPIQPASAQYSPPAPLHPDAQSSPAHYRNGPPDPTQAEIAALEAGGVARYERAESREEDGEDHRMEARDTARSSVANGSATDPHPDGESSQAASSGFTAVNR
ncbi:hypothetical protein NA57DRAFT_73841 [Rhizodiscina lignyota]|uniref:INO80 complex subunit F domain-containing protein n=1 Tax=Rhizodiscina lignyota TaxID=1504668 RepID=A0A9P4ILA4_9PEZI|nr:hypothetical protein NA57DRAFT_73841 [Rhizodiscina lignyota]